MEQSAKFVDIKLRIREWKAHDENSVLCVNLSKCTKINLAEKKNV